MKKVIKLYTDKNEEFTLGFDKETNQAFLSIDSEIIEKLLEKEEIPNSELASMLMEYKLFIDNLLSTLKESEE